MKIALLTLPIDNNYGGNLQRYALIKTMEKMGHTVVHINMRFPYRTISKRGFFVYCDKLLKIARLKHQNYYDDFYRKHVRNHTKEFHSKKNLIEIGSYDVIVVGSDQVWRKEIAHNYGIGTYFFDFLKGKRIRRIAYGASFGTDFNELTDMEISQLGDLYKLFDAVSVRETSGIELIKSYDWESPHPVCVLDPTFLLSVEDYIALFESVNTTPSNGSLFCYILDKSKEKDKIIEEKVRKSGLVPYSVTLGTVSIEQWLRSFYDSKYVITDSFHGVVFSIIFNKPFFLLNNQFRGNARFESLFDMLKIQPKDSFDWKTVNRELEIRRCESVKFLKDAIGKG